MTYSLKSVNNDFLLSRETQLGREWFAIVLREVRDRNKGRFCLFNPT